MRRKLLLLLETGVVLAGLLMGASAWKIHSALVQPLNIAQEQLLDVPKGTTPTRTFYRLEANGVIKDCLLYTSPSPRDRTRSRMPSSA